MRRLSLWFVLTVPMLAQAGPLVAQVRQPQPARKPHLYGRVVFVSIGIQDYEFQADLPPAPAAEADAAEMASRMQSVYGYEALPLIGPKATKKAIEKTIKETGIRLGREDALIVFFSGHGQVIEVGDTRREGYLIPYDAELALDRVKDSNRWEEQAINMRKFVDELDNSNVGHVVVLVDACCSGFMTGRGGSTQAVSENRSLLMTPSRKIIAATTEVQKATTRIARGREHGIFTSALLASLDQPRPDAKSVQDVFDEVLPAVQAASHENMTPRSSPFGKAGKGTFGEFVFLPLAIPAADIEAAKLGRALLPVVRRQQERDNSLTRIDEVIAAFEAPDYRFATRPGVQKDRQSWERRRKIYETKAAGGDPLAMQALSYCLARSLGGEKDEPGAYRWARDAYETEHPGGKHVLGRSIYYGIGVEKNELAGENLIEEAAKEGYQISLLSKGYRLLDEGDLRGAERAWKQAGDRGVLSARVNCANLYLGVYPETKRQEMVPDPRLAIEVLKPAADQGLPAAQLVLARAYARFLKAPEKNALPRWLVEEARGKDVITHTRDRALYWLDLAASSGDASAQAAYASELMAGHPIVRKHYRPLGLELAPDLKSAKRWADLAMRQAEAQSNGDIISAIANVYQHTGSFEKAEEGLKKLRAIDRSRALQLESGWCLEGSQLKRPSVEDAFRLAEEAVRLGDSQAKIWIGALYADSTVPRSELEQTPTGLTGVHHTLHYWTLASDQDDCAADDYLGEYAIEIVKDPDVAFWNLFKKEYGNEEVRRFKFHCRSLMSGLRLGVIVEDLNGSGPKRGVFVKQIVPNGPAARAGLWAGDVLLSIDNETFDSEKAFDRTLVKSEGEVRIKFQKKDGKMIDARVILIEEE